MDIHKPKPIHNLRELGSEIIVIVIGVLIALSLEQLVEMLHWHHRVADAERALSLELSDTYGQAEERELTYDCVEGRLDYLAAAIDEASLTGKLPPIGEIGVPPGRTWTKGAWESTIGGQTAEHFPAERRVQFAQHYLQVSTLQERGQRESALWTSLYAMVGPGRKIEHSELAHLRELVGQARFVNRATMTVGLYLRQQLDGFIEKDQPTIQFYRGPTSDYEVCRPIGAVPDHYGAAPGSDWVQRGREGSFK